MVKVKLHSYLCTLYMPPSVCCVIITVKMNVELGRFSIQVVLCRTLLSVICSPGWFILMLLFVCWWLVIKSTFCKSAVFVRSSWCYRSHDLCNSFKSDRTVLKDAVILAVLYILAGKFSIELDSWVYQAHSWPGWSCKLSFRSVSRLSMLFNGKASLINHLICCSEQTWSLPPHDV